MAHLVLSALLALQEEKVIGRAAKDPYLAALKKYDEAVESVEKNPKHAVKLIDEILGDAKVVEKECKLKIEQRPGDPYKKADFFPYQIRGRAYAKQAETAERESAMELLKKAIDDFKESEARKLASSKPLREDAEKKLQKLKTEGVDPEPEFRRSWQTLLSRGDFAAAKASVEKADFLSSEKKKQYLGDTESACRELYTADADRFLTSLEMLQGPRGLRSMTNAAFDRGFELTDRKNLIVPHAAYEWCVAVRATLKTLRDGKDALDALLDHAVQSALSKDAGSFRWYTAAEALAFELVRDELDKRADEARNAAAEDRKKLRGQAEALVKKWQDFDAKARKAAGTRADFAQMPKREFTSILDKFPVDDESLNKILTQLQGTAEADDPDRALTDVETELDKMLSKFDRLPMETRRAVLTYQIVAAALHGFLLGRTEDDLVRDLKTTARRLREEGGSFEVKSFGPKIQKVFERLK